MHLILGRQLQRITFASSLGRSPKNITHLKYDETVIRHRLLYSLFLALLFHDLRFCLNLYIAFDNRTKCNTSEY